jgi:hypothetical protein
LIFHPPIECFIAIIPRYVSIPVEMEEEKGRREQEEIQ